MGYKSPIDIIYGDIQIEVEDNVVKAIQGCNIDIDKDELIKALNYDRNQYNKGYKDGVNDVLDKIRAEIEQNTYPIIHGVNNHEKGMTLYGILQVIDKYKESEG